MYRLILLFAFAGAALAAEVRMGAETPLTPLVVPGPAAYQQATPSVASNGHEFYAVWVDSRDSRTLGTFATEGTIYGTRLDWQGRPLEPFGRVLAATGMQPMVASNGDGYLVVWRAWNGPIHLLPLDRNGEPAGPERILRKQRYPATVLRHFGTNGTTYVLIGEHQIWTHGFETLGHVLDGEGNVIAELPLPSSFESIPSRPWTLGAREGIHELVTYTETHYQPVLLSIDDTGSVVDRRDLAPGPPRASDRSAAAAGERVAIAWNSSESNRTLTLAVFERDGTPVRPPRTLEFSEPVGVAQMLNDGDGFLLLYVSSSPSASHWSRLSALQVSPEGEVKGGPWVLTDAAQSFHSNVSFASNGSTQVLAWCDFQNSRAGDVVVRAVRDSGALAGPASAARLLTLSGAPQAGADVAVAKSRLAAVWYDEQRSQVRGVVGGKEFLVAEAPADLLGTPAVAMGEDNLLVAWPQLAESPGWTYTSKRVLARRFTFDGVPLDAAPLVLSGDLPYYLLLYPQILTPVPDFLPRPQLRFDGSSFVAALFDDKAIRIARIDPRTGAVTASIHPTADQKPVQTIPGLAAAGTGIVVPYCTEGGGCFLLRDGGGSNGARHIALPGIYLGVSVEIAEERVTYVTYSASYVYTYRRAVIHQLTLDGNPLPGTFSLPDDLYTGPVEIRWNGTEYVAAFLAGNRVRALRLTRDLQPLDVEPFDVSPEGSPRYFQPHIAATNGGVVIAYSRTAEENGRAPRLFVRTLERLSPLPERRRGVRH